MSAVSSSISRPGADQALPRRRAPERGQDAASDGFSLREAGEPPAAQGSEPKPAPGGTQVPPVGSKDVAVARAVPASIPSPSHPAAAEQPSAATGEHPLNLGAIVSLITIEAGESLQGLRLGKSANEAEAEPGGSETIPEGTLIPAVSVPATPTPVAIAAAGLPTAMSDQAAAEAGDAAAQMGLVFGKPSLVGSQKAPLHAPDAGGPQSHGEANGSMAADPAAAATHGVADAVQLASKAHGSPDSARAPEKAADPSAPAQGLLDVFKAAEPQQQALSPIDLSAAAIARALKPEGAALPAPDQLAAPEVPRAGGQRGGAEGQPTPLHVVPVEIGLRALAGSKRFDIRLDPPELGRVDVNLEISDKGEVSAKLVVDRVETLHLLQRDARTLERAFEQAGLKPSDGGVDISLRDPGDQSGFRQQRQEDETPPRTRPLPELAEAGEASAIPAQPAPLRRLVRLGGVDLSV